MVGKKKATERTVWQQGYESCLSNFTFYQNEYEETAERSDDASSYGKRKRSRLSVSQNGVIPFVLVPIGIKNWPDIPPGRSSTHMLPVTSVWDKRIKKRWSVLLDRPSFFVQIEGAGREKGAADSVVCSPVELEIGLEPTTCWLRINRSK